MDETEIEAQSPSSGALPSVAGGPDAFLSRFDALNAAAQQAAAAEKETRRQLFEQTEQRLLAPQRLRFGSPEVTQTLFGLANALVSPRPYGGFAGTMANVMPVLSQSAQSMSDAQQQREATLRQLREQYQLGTATADTTAAERELSNLATLARFYEPQAEPQPVWSENLEQFIPRSGSPVVTRSRTLPDGSRADKLTDGTTRITDPAGQVGIYDAGGNLISQGGAQ